MNETEKLEKRFDEWNELKKITHSSSRVQAIKEGEIWWCATGENVGIEINGKSKTFARPVLVYKKLSRLGFLGVPLTTQEHVGDWYVPFVFQERQQFAVLAQTKTFSVLRAYRRMGTISERDFSLVASGFSKLYSIKQNTS